MQEENGRAALLLEQSAYALLYLPLPSQRKFAFQMVLAGLRYHSCGQKRLATQAYRCVCWHAVWGGRRLTARIMRWLWEVGLVGRLGCLKGRDDSMML